ncbi:MAG: cupin domain-containing protein [Gemmatimonadetes bacterium]|nr:cupin domain-containing protein [Gemmatimonadota bacterium]
MLVSPGEGELIQIGGFGTRYKIHGANARGAAIIEHTLEPGLLGSPMHRHTREDEISCVLAGELTIQIGDQVHTATVGSVVLKPRGIFHAFWNAGSETTRFLEVIVPGGFEEYFRELRQLVSEDLQPDMGAIAALAASYGLELDFGSLHELLERHQLRFG